MQGAMGPVPLTHSEIRCWQENIGISLNSWEARALFTLSQEYAAQAQLSTKPDCIPPYGPVAHRAAVAKKIDEIFG